MPDRYTDEEIEREHLLCLLDFECGDVPNRCSRCPNAPTAAGAAEATRLTLQRRRCPRDDLLASAFRAAADPDRKIRDESKSSASSSKLPSLPQETSSHETDGEPLVDNLAQMSLTDAHATSTFDVSVTLAASREKRKAVVEPESQAKHQKKVVDSKYEFSGLAVKEWLQNKPQIPFQDADVGMVRGCWRFSEACWTSMMKESLQDARLTMAPLEDQPAATTSYAGPSGSFVAGCNVNTEAEGHGVFPCNDGIETGVPDEMDCED